MLFSQRLAALEQFFRSAKPTSPPLYLSASTADLKTVETWISHIGEQLDGIVAKRGDASYRPGMIEVWSRSRTIGAQIV